MIARMLTVLVILSGCATTPDSPRGPDHRAHANDNSFVVMWSADADPISPSEYFSMNVRIEPDALGREQIGEDLRVDAGMPSHRHGMNVVPTVHRAGEGRWVVHDMLLHMPGEWVITFDVTNESGHMSRAQTTIHVD